MSKKFDWRITAKSSHAYQSVSYKWYWQRCIQLCYWRYTFWKTYLRSRESLPDGHKAVTKSVNMIVTEKSKRSHTFSLDASDKIGKEHSFQDSCSNLPKILKNGVARLSKSMILKNKRRFRTGIVSLRSPHCSKVKEIMVHILEASDVLLCPRVHSKRLGIKCSKQLSQQFLHSARWYTPNFRSYSSLNSFRVTRSLRLVHRHSALAISTFSLQGRS